MDKRINLVKALGITYKEDIISNMIVALIKHSRSFRESFLSKLINLQQPSDFSVRIYTRILTSVGIPDIVSVIENERECYLLIIENKLKADEGYKQTLRYASKECITELKKILGLSDRKVEEKFIFLTLVPESIPTSSLFINISYEDLINNIPSPTEDVGLKMLYEDLSDVLLEFYKDLDITDNDLILEKFTEKTEPERLKVRFRKLMNSISNLPNGLSRSPIDEVVGTGRINYIVQFSKKSWKGKIAQKTEEGKYLLNEDTFDIHVEFTFDAFNRSFTLPLHYETRPYLPKRKIANHSEGSEKYLYQREIVKRMIHEKIKSLNDQSIKCYNGSNQIANTKIVLNENTTVKEFKEQLLLNLRKISEFVDETVSELKAMS
ncbi:hypothetical protein [Aeribacillus pallidus]|uniref:hypothetical protein n=1 Tax=Aeribacillus pallidus TaxID=33936 RepID=UPI003D196837